MLDYLPKCLPKGRGNPNVVVNVNNMASTKTFDMSLLHTELKSPLNRKTTRMQSFTIVSFNPYNDYATVLFQTCNVCSQTKLKIEMILYCSESRKKSPTAVYYRGISQQK